MDTPLHLSAEPESLDQLLGDCALMAPHWRVTDPSPAASVPVPPEILGRVVVPSRSAHLLDGMSEYGDFGYGI